jgi:hypothetical protein
MTEEGASTRRTVPQEPGTKQMMISVDKSNIKVPVDVQDALEINESLTVTGTVLNSITMDKRGYGFVQALAYSDVGARTHIYTLDFSFDNALWFNEYTSAIAEVSINRTVSSTARYWRLGFDANAASNHNVTVVLGATLSS